MKESEFQTETLPKKALPFCALRFASAQLTVGVRPFVFSASLTTASSGKVEVMAPTVVRDGPYRLFFFSREESRIHVHVAHPDGEAKFWLTPVVSAATTTGLSSKQVSDAKAIVEAHLKEIQDAWNHHFGS